MLGRKRDRDDPFAGLRGDETRIASEPATARREPSRRRRGAGGLVAGALGLLLALGALVAFDWALYEVVQTGTCASGGPYVSARQCPEGTGLRVAVLMLAVPLGLVGCALLSASRRGRWRAAVGVWVVAWALLFVSSAVVALVAVNSSDEPVVEGAKSGITIMAVVFIAMGLAPLALLALGRGRGGEGDGLSGAASGRILAVEDTGVTVSSAHGVSLPGTRRVRVTVQVEPEGGEPYIVTTAAVVPDHAAAEVGGRVQVRHARGDRESVELRFPARVRPVGESTA